jgi:hypothetical protein
MRRQFLVAVITVCVMGQSSSTGAISTAPPVPPVQTQMQREIFAQHAAQAAIASPQATPEVLEAFDDPDFRAALERCCPDFAKHSSGALLEEFRAQMSVIEIIHNFHPTVNENGSDHRPNSADVTLSMLKNASYLYNMWELAPLNLTDVSYIEGWIGMSAKMENGLLRYPPFSRADAPSGRPFPYGGWPKNWAEASERPVYAATNQWYSDAGWPWYGSVGVVLAEQIKSFTTIGPFDTGLWESGCNTSSPWCQSHGTDRAECDRSDCVWGAWDGGGCFKPTSQTIDDSHERIDCRVWQPGVGSDGLGVLKPAHMDHLILPSVRWYNSSRNVVTGGDPKRNLQQLAERMFSPWESPATNITLRLQYHYWVSTRRLHA